MKDKIQYEKAENKIAIIENLFLSLTDYNNLVNYNNNKRFSLNIAYFYDTFEKCYRYTFELTRGINKPKKVLELRLQYKDKINELLEQMINRVIKNENFSYMSFGRDEQINKCFSINMKNDLSIDFEIRDQEDLDLYTGIKEKYNKNVAIIVEDKPNIDEETKDKLQEEKAITIINIIKKILNSLNTYNCLDDYENTKRFELIVTNTELTDYTKFKFKILRGVYKTDNIIELSLSIKDTKIIYEQLYELMLEFISKDEFLYNTLSNSEYNKYFNINLKNGIVLSFEIKNETDKLFYENFFNEYRHEIYDREKQKLKTKTEYN